jgi:hypothetical protein
LESKVTLISLLSPGLIGSLGGDDVVQPQVDSTKDMMRFEFPVFLNLKE